MHQLINPDALTFPAISKDSLDALTKEAHGKAFRDIIICVLRAALEEDGAPARCRLRLCRRENGCLLDNDIDDGSIDLPRCRAGVSPAVEARAVRTARLILGLWADGYLTVEPD